MRWRLIDLAQWVFEEFRLSIAVQTLSRELRKMGYRKLSARPRHHAQAEGAIEVFKTYGPPRLQAVLSRAPFDQSATTYPASEWAPRPRWRYARPGPHKTFGVERRFLNQASRTPFDCRSGHLSIHHPQTSSAGQRLMRRPTNSYAARDAPLAVNASLRRNTAQAIRANLLAKATTATF